MKEIFNNLKTEYFINSTLLNKNFLDQISKINARYEKMHTGEILIVIEKSMSLVEIFSGKTPAQKAFEHFCLKKVWDTETNCGVLIYILIASHYIEIIADRKVKQKLPSKTWEKICQKTVNEFRKKNYQKGLKQILIDTSNLLIKHFPSNGKINKRSEISNQPVIG